MQVHLANEHGTKRMVILQRIFGADDEEIEIGDKVKFRVVDVPSSPPGLYRRPDEIRL